MRSSIRRLIALVTAGVVASIVLVHLPPVRARIVRWGLEWLGSEQAIAAHVGQASYNLLTGDVRLRGVTMAAVGSEAAPFLTAAELHVTLPWSVLSGEFSLQSLDVTGLRISIVRRADGSLNLPASQGTGAGMVRLPVGRLALSDASVAYRDDARDFSVEAGGIQVSLVPQSDDRIAGSLTVATGPLIRIGDHESRATQLLGQIGFDGTTLSLERVRYEAPEGQFDISGQLSALFASPRADLEVTGSTALSSLSTWLDLEPAARGTMAVTASVTGPLADPTANLALESDGVSWSHVPAMALRARAMLTTSSVTLSSATLSLQEGVLSARGQAAFDLQEGRFRLDWRALPTAPLLGPLSPFPIASRLQGRLDFSWDGTDAGAWRIAGENEAEPIADGRTGVQISGRESLVVEHRQWQLRHDHDLSNAVRVTGEAAGQLSTQALSASTLGGSATVSVRDLAKVMPVLRGAEIAVSDRLGVTGGTLMSTLRLSGTIGAPSATGTARIADLYVSGVGPAQVESALTIDTDRASVERLEVTLGANHASVSGSLAFPDATIRGTATLDLSELARFAPTWPAEWQPSGAVSASVNLGGSIASLVVDGRVDGRALTAAKQPIDELTARLEYARGSLVARSIDLRQATGGYLTATGAYSFSTGAYVLETTGRDLALQPLDAQGIWPAAPDIDVEFESEGTTAHPGGAGLITFGRLTWRDVEIRGGAIDVSLSDFGMHAIARVPSLATTINGTIGWKAPWPFTMSADVEDADLAELAREASIARRPPFVSDLQGRADLTAAAMGTLEDLAGSSAVLALHRLEIQANHAQMALVRPAELQYARSHIDARDVELRSGGTTLTLGGRLTDQSSERGLQAEMNGDLRDVRPWLEMFRIGQPLNMAGQTAASLAVTGSLERPILNGAVSVDDASVSLSDDLSEASGVSLEGALADGVVDVPQLGARWQGAVLTGRARIPIGLFEPWLPRAVIRALPVQTEDATLVARVDDITKAVLAPWLDAAASGKLDGRASIAVDLHAPGPDLAQVLGSVTLDQLEMSVAGLLLTQIRPTRLEVANRSIRIVDWTWDAAGNRFAVSGGLSLAGTRDLDLAVSGLVDMRLVGAFLPDVTTGGLADLALRLHGPISAPAADGSLQFRDGELRIADPQIEISGVAGRAVLEGQRVRIVDVDGVANGGRIVLSGEVRHEGAVVTDGRMVMAGRGINLNAPQGLRTEIDMDLTLALAGDRAELSGTVSMRRGAYREPLSLAAGFVSAARQRAAVALVPAQGSWLDGIALNVAIASAEELIVDNNYGRMDLGVDVRVVGTVDRPSVLGRAAIRESGVLYLGGRVYQVESGLIDFTSPTEIVPDLTITARTRISGYDITLAITGTPDALQGNLVSDPPLGQSDIVSLLVTGRMASDIGGAETAIAREQVLGYLSGEVLGFAAQAVGLDTLRLERGGGLEGLRADPSLVAGEADPSSRLTLSKTLSRNVEVVLSQDLRESGHMTWIVTYTPRSNIDMRAVSRDDRSRSYGLNHQLSFGAPVAVAPTRNIAVAGREQIADIRIVGVTDRSESDLRALLTLQQGDRFDFYGWQRDRERLRRFYIEHGYLEGRVGARRIDDSPANEGEIVLEYDIDQGPHTMLAVGGHPLPSRLFRELEAIWSNAVFNEARLADLRRHVRRYLAGEGYLRAEVVVMFESPEPPVQKLIRITIVPGLRSTSREIRFAGNQVVSTARLAALISGTDLRIVGWLDPAAVAREVEALYQNEGRLAVSVTAGPPEFTGGRAVLPVNIDEGSPFSVTDVTLSGVGTTREADVRRAFGLEPGAVFVPQEVEQRRRSVEAAYRRQGFNAVRVAVRTEVNLTGAAARLTVQVEEGPQQVLQAVVVQGADGVRPEVISRALALTPGDPVDMAVWYQARRRLLDSGLFRRVDVEAVAVEPPDPAATAAAIQPMTAQVTLEPWPLWRLRYGAEITDEAAPAGESRRFGGGLTADLQRRSLFGRAGTLGLSARWNRNQQIGRGFLSFPRFFSLPLSSSLFLSRSREQIGEEGFLTFITDKTTLTAEQGLAAGRRLRISYGYQFERNHTFDPRRDPDDPLGLDFTVRQARLTSTSVIDTRDDPFDAGRGLMHSSTFEYAAEVLGSDVRFVKYTLQQFFYRRLRGRVVSASAARIGAGRGFGQDLIPSERFFTGGGNTVRGYRENSLGATDFFGDPRGGHGLVVLNQEARFPLFRWIRGVGFIDAGNVFGFAGDLSLTNLKIGVGGGVRLATPFGLFRLDVGVPLSRERSGRTPRLHFSLGQIF